MGRVGRAVAGVAAAGAALATTEIVGAVVARSRPSVLDAVAQRLVDVLAGPLEQQAIRWFGTHDKQALLVGIVAVALGIGAALGLAAYRWPWTGPVGFAVFAGVGVLAVWRDPTAPIGRGALAAALGAALGAVALWGRSLPCRRAPSDDEPQAGRRHLLLGSGAVAAAAALGGGWTRRLRTGRADAFTRAAGVLPRPRRAVRPPSASPFALDGLPTYETPIADFFRIDTEIYVPRVEVATWTLAITGLVDHPRTYTYDDLLAMPMVEEMVTLACVSNDVGGHLVANARWLGVPLRDLLGPAGVRPEGDQIVGRAVDDFTVNVATATALDGRVAMVAVGMNGEPLPVDHGYPARLVVAGQYGYASATKWLRELQLTRRDDQKSYWVALDWAKEGPVKLQSRFDVPQAGAQLTAGPVHLAGMAWAPSIGIARVQVQIDNGPWHDAELGTVVSADTWVHWSYVWTEASKGDHVAAVRATDRRGNVQTDVPTTPKPSGATGWHYRSFSVVR